MTRAANSALRFARALDASSSILARTLGRIDRLVDHVARDSRAVARDSRDLYTAMADQVRGAGLAVRSTPRFARIVSEITALSLRYRMHRIRTEASGRPYHGPALDRLHRDCAARVRDLCLELRGGVLKLGQFVSSRVDLLPAAYIEELSRLQDRVPPVPTAEIVERVEQELGRPLEDLFESFDDEPLAAASLAQVHKATLPDGTAVAVKVKVPGVDEAVRTDLAALRASVDGLGDLLGDILPPTDFDTIAQELSRAVSEELDFAAEADNARAFRERFSDWDDVVVPRVFGELSTSRVLVMELIDGRRLTDFLAEAAPAERDRLITTMVKAFCAQVLEHGAFHGDPHPGNFLVVPGPRLAILDFGSVPTLSAERRDQYAELVTAVFARHSERVGELLGALGFATHSGAPESLVELANMMLRELGPRALAGNPAEFDARAELARALAAVRADPVVRVPADFVLLGRLFGSLGGLILRYPPQTSLFTVLAPYLARR